MYIGYRSDRRYLCLRSTWRIFGKFVELRTGRSGEYPEILFNTFSHYPRSGPTFEKIPFHYRYVTLRKFRNSAGDIFKKL